MFNYYKCKNDFILAKQFMFIILQYDKHKLFGQDEIILLQSLWHQQGFKYHYNEFVKDAIIFLIYPTPLSIAKQVIRQAKSYQLHVKSYHLYVSPSST